MFVSTAGLSFNVPTIVYSWYSEITNYNYDKDECNGPCDSYRQVRARQVVVYSLGLSTSVPFSNVKITHKDTNFVCKQFIFERLFYN